MLSTAPSRRELARQMRGHTRFGTIYLAMLILSFHWAIVAYVNSTFLEQYISSTAVGVLYTIGSTLTILTFFFISRVLRVLGNFQLTIGLAAAEFVILLGLAFGDSMRIIVPLFVLHHAIVPLLLFNLDVFVECLIGKKEEGTGGKRGMLLTTISAAGAVAPLSMGFLLGGGEPRFMLVYLASALILAVFGFLIWKNFHRFKDPVYREIKVLSTIHEFWVYPNLRFVFVAHLLLQMFFAWMVIYTPLYLATMIGFSWSDIGFILFVGLMAYVVLEYPIGEIADRYFGEKEMMAIGFLIMAVATGWMSFIAVAAVVPWAITLFITRVGASLVETTTESYFFKRIEGSDANIISFFRITRPLSYIGGALLGSLFLLYIPFTYIFLALGLCLLPGIVFALMLEDTK